MKNILSCSTHSYHGFSFERALKGIADSGLSYVELGAIPGHTEHVCPERMNRMQMRKLKAVLAEYGLTASAISGHSNLATDQGLELFKKRLELAEELGVQYVNTADGDTGTQEGREAFFKNIRLAAEYSPSTIICLETHGGLIGTAEVCRSTLHTIDKPNVKVNYDPANLVFFEDIRPETDIKASLPLIGHFHIKDKLDGKGIWNFPTIGTGYLDYEMLLGTLRDGKYSGPLSFELEFTTAGVSSPEYVDASLKQSVEYIRGLTSKLAW